MLSDPDIFPIKSQTFLSSHIYYLDFLIFILSVNSGCPKTFDWQGMSKIDFFFCACMQKTLWSLIALRYYINITLWSLIAINKQTSHDMFVNYNYFFVFLKFLSIENYNLKAQAVWNRCSVHKGLLSLLITFLDVNDVATCVSKHL